MAKEKSQLTKHLFLNSYINKLFGKQNFSEFRSILKSVTEGSDEQGQSYIFKVLQGYQSEITIPMNKLEAYDNNIKSYMNYLNRGREKPLRLKYFQYLSVLFTEIYLDLYFTNPVKLLNDLNDFTYNFIQKQFPSEKNIDDYLFSKDDLRKLAFWMATGSGKTHILTINYLQFLKYNQGPNQVVFDNIILITPSETLTDQHIEEMKKSNIPCMLFLDVVSGYFPTTYNKNNVKVIDIHKLTEQKKGQGVRIDIENFGNKNLVFVDEGHKGSGGYTWKYLRKKIAEKGFTFEYSATFSQAIAAAGKEKDELLHEYGKSIIFDYSYKHFYGDNYGKEYRILNLKDKTFSDTTRNMLMIANLLSYYEQKLVFEEHKNDIQSYHIQEPLWIFVGSKVQGKQEDSDILTVVKFLKRVTIDKQWAIECIGKILKGNSGLLDKQDRDLFSPTYPEKKLKYIREKHYTPEAIYHDLLKKIFHIDNPAALHLINIKNAAGEIALRAGTSKYFGVINIGDDAGFLKKVETEKDIPIESDDLSESLFDDINTFDSTMNILIGAKKFIEGWNSYRVSNMGLLNIGKSEGSQIIQLFGRGVRLYGKDFSFKRSKLEENPPPYINILETLNIFGIKANYMEQFREHLEIEDIPVENYIEIPLEIQIETNHIEKELLIPHIDTSRFKKEELFELQMNTDIRARIDLMPKIEIITSLKEGGIQATKSNPVRKIEQKYLDILDWNEIYFELLEYKKDREWHNIIISKEILKKILETISYSLYCPEIFVKPHKFEDITRLQDIVTSILKKYFQSFYNEYRDKWLQDHMEIIKLTDDDDNLSFEEYTLKINEEEPLMIAAIKSLVATKLEEIRREYSSDYFANIYFDRHLYQPLLSESNLIDISPAGLNEGEQTFVKDLRQFFETHIKLLQDSEIFILRNLPRKGIGFFESNFFYPDFIIWVKRNNKQHLIFVDPKSLAHMWEGLDEEKIKQYETIRELGQKLKQRTGKEVAMDSFIISINPYNEIRGNFDNKPQNKLEENHVLFQQDDKNHYIQKLLSVAFNT